jgi:hypothetical protein
MSAFGYLVRFPVVEGVVAAILLLSLRSAWARAPTVQQHDCVEERSLGATVIMGQLSAIITGSSIILTGIGAFVALKSDVLQLPLSQHLFYAVTWAVVALGIAIYTMGVLPPRTPRRNFVRDRTVAFCCSLALFFCLASAVRFLVAVWGILPGAP